MVLTRYQAALAQFLARRDNDETDDKEVVLNTPAQELDLDSVNGSDMEG